MVKVPDLPAATRLVLAELSGAAGRYGIGHDRDKPHEEAIAAITR